MRKPSAVFSRSVDAAGLPGDLRMVAAISPLFTFSSASAWPIVTSWNWISSLAKMSRAVSCVPLPTSPS